MNMMSYLEKPLLDEGHISRKSRDLLQHGFATIQMPKGFLAKHVPIIFDGMRRITDDVELRKIFASAIIMNDETGEDYDVGLWRKTDNIKDFFHWQSLDHSRREEWLRYPGLEAFFASCEATNGLAKNIILSFAQVMDNYECNKGRFGGIAEAVLRGSVVTRILRYPARTDAQADAKVHFDRAFGTLHLYATDQGLAIFDQKYNVHSAYGETSLNLANVILGKKFAAITNGRYGLGALHGVRRKDREIKQVIDDRFVLVVFVHAALTSKQVETWHRLKPNFDSVEARYRAVF